VGHTTRHGQDDVIVPRGYRESACLQDTQHLSSTLVVCRDWFHMLAAIPGWPHLRSQAQRSSTAVHVQKADPGKIRAIMWPYSGCCCRRSSRPVTCNSQLAQPASCGTLRPARRHIACRADPQSLILPFRRPPARQCQAPLHLTPRLP
jgi:hypothetical protein